MSEVREPVPAGDWGDLCNRAEAAADSDPTAFARDWLPAALERVADWPPEVRRPPMRWFTTERDPQVLAALLQLGAVTDGDLAYWEPVRDETDPDGTTWWSLNVAHDPEITVRGTRQAPDPVALQVARWVEIVWPRLESESLDCLRRLAIERGGDDDPYIEQPCPADERFLSGGLVRVETPVPSVRVNCDDDAHSVNGWPYGQWEVEFCFGRIRAVFVGPRDDSRLVWSPGTPGPGEPAV